MRKSYSYSINLQAFYHKCCSAIEYAIRYLFSRRQRVAVVELNMAVAYSRCKVLSVYVKKIWTILLLWFERPVDLS